MARTKKIPDRGNEKKGKSKNVIENTTKKKLKDHAFREIVKYQQSIHHLIPRAPFSRLVRTVLQRIVEDGGSAFRNREFRVTKECLICLHEACEIYLTVYFEDLNLLAQHAKRVTIMAKDVESLKHLKRSNTHGLLS